MARQHSMTRRKKASLFLTHVVLIMGCIAFGFPFAWLISTSLKPDLQILSFPPTWIPRPVVWSNYKEMMRLVPFWKFFWNTSYMTVLSIIGVLISSSMGAYAFSRLRWPGRDVIFLLFLGTMMIPSEVTMIPLYLIFRNLGWIDTLKPMWVPAFFGQPFNIFLLRQFMMTLPKDLEDAAKIDGCSYLQIYLHVIMPLVKPALATVGVFTFMARWHSLMTPLIYINSRDQMTLSLRLRLFQENGSTQWGPMMAYAATMTLPIVIMFFFAQRQFIQGIALTGMKG